MSALGRIKLQLWNVRQRYWCTAYVRPSMLMSNIIALEKFGFTVRTGGDCR